MRTGKHRKNNVPDVNVITLGCSKNLVDSENLLTQLTHAGISNAHQGSSQSPIVVINTCGFIDRAKEESIQSILDHIELKNSGEIEKLYVTGCLSERYREDLASEMPEVDGFFGTQDLPALLNRFEVDYKAELLGERRSTTSSHYAYLKIAEGCNRPCGFCAIPLMRGEHRSRPLEDLVAEARFLVSRGVKEILLIAQELTYYGLDLYGKRCLADLIDALATEVEGLRWLRLHYAYPAGFPLEVLGAMRRHENVCKYLDLPLQHISDPVLQSMRRGISEQKTRELIKTIRDRVPGIALRTTFLVGYPTETDADFETLVQFVEEMQFERAGVFQYSHEEGTHAYQFPDAISSETKQRRADALMAVQQNISFSLNKKKRGQIMTVLIDRHEGEAAIGRTEADSPEVDNEVVVYHGSRLKTGEFYQVHIVDATEFDLMAEPVLA
jgi:ribosomal protein S12 methylthiotransferase